MFGRLAKGSVWGLLLLAAAAGVPPVSAQKAKPTRPPENLAAKVEQSRADLIEATHRYQDSLRELLPFYQSTLEQAQARRDKLKILLDQGLIARREIETAEDAVRQAESKITEARRLLDEADLMIAEVKADIEEEKNARLTAGQTRSTGVYVRFAGFKPWKLADFGLVQVTFTREFGHNLPISAFGQTAVHEKLGFDHSQAVDVAVHPDSSEGQALMGLLRSSGISYIAFRQAVPGSATGPHIHIGPPSHRRR